jgi:hypothetical protein
MSARACVILVAFLALCACQGTAQQNTIGQPVYQAPLGSPGPTTSVRSTGTVAAASAPPAFDRNGNANYDSNGTYIGGHGIGTTVDSPENKYGIPEVSVPTVSTPDISGLKCNQSSGANAGTLNCSN